MHADLAEAVDFHKSIIAEGSKALVGYDTAKALANVVLMSEIPTTYDKSEQRQVNAGNLLLRGVPGVGCELAVTRKSLGVTVSSSASVFTSRRTVKGPISSESAPSADMSSGQQSMMPARPPSPVVCLSISARQSTPPAACRTVSTR